MTFDREALVLVALVVVAGGACASAPSDPDLTAGRTVYRTCAACHGPSGDGGVGPPLHDVLETFPDCTDHRRWIALGSQRWRDEVGPTYGRTGRPIEGAMPSFEADLGADAIAQAALYERVRFGGADPNTERAACGLTS